ncbi:hypothetical protein NA56DRAFT_662298 [Hyaloscypha hepaticicola]|uniref:Uncharacterized protein n=1 Tax=Hyaloscypha hepaticicola TaxID=2082293 RepID=A0A2J6PTH3_9HELO|nr:hypothetical protein NA56DRAFT_662298 [Hyaloscypha hepaticicola]
MVLVTLFLRDVGGDNDELDVKKAKGEVRMPCGTSEIKEDEFNAGNAKGVQKWRRELLLPDLERQRQRSCVCTCTALASSVTMYKEASEVSKPSSFGSSSAFPRSAGADSCYESWSEPGAEMPASSGLPFSTL